MSNHRPDSTSSPICRRLRNRISPSGIRVRQTKTVRSEKIDNASRPTPENLSYPDSGGMLLAAAAILYQIHVPCKKKTEPLGGPVNAGPLARYAQCFDISNNIVCL